MTLYAVKALAAPALFQPGPTGTKAPWNWPYAYSKAASVTVTSAAALQTAINAASPGDVIECNANVSGTAGTPLHITTPSGWSARSVGVLVRPPLGTRRTLSYVYIEGHHLILGGFDWDHLLGSYAKDPSTQAGGNVGPCLWRCVGSSTTSFLNWLGTRQGSLVEVVMPHRVYNATGDIVDVYAHGAADQVDLTVDGCYFAGGIVGYDTMLAQIGELDSVSAATYSQAATGTGTITGLTVALRNLPAGASCTVAISVNGTTVYNGTVPDSSANTGDFTDFRVVTGLSQAVVAGQTVSVTVSGIVGALPHMTVYLGVRSTTHIDTMQFGVAGFGAGPNTNGSSRGALVRDSVFQGSGGETLQFNYLQGGDYRFIRNWFGYAFGSASGSMNCSGFQTPDRAAQLTPADPLRLHLVDNHFNRGPNLITGTSVAFPSWLVTLLGNTQTNTSDWPVGADASNIKGATLGPPPLPDLATLWPDCPITVSN